MRGKTAAAAVVQGGWPRRRQSGWRPRKASAPGSTRSSSAETYQPPSSCRTCPLVGYFGAVYAFVLPLHQAGQGHHTIVRIHLDESDALRRPSNGPDVARNGPQNLPLLRDEHELIIIVHRGHSDDAAVSFARLDVNNTHTAPGLHPIFVKLRPFAVSVLRDGQERASRPHHLHGNYLVAFTEGDAPHPVGRPSHGPDV